MGISIIGIGGAGGNIADKWAKAGYHAGAINFSKKDLESLENVKYKCKILGSDGLGHERSEAIKYISEQPDKVIDFIQEHFINQSNDIIVFAFATGGGSGSGLTPIILQLCTNKFPEHTFVCMPIIPDISESVTSQVNTINAFKELVDSNVCVLPIDNQQIKQIVDGNGKHKIYEYGNEKVVQLLGKLYSFTDIHSQRGNFDSKDLHNLFKTSGLSIIADLDITQIKSNEEYKLNTESVTKAVNSSWNHSIFTPPEKQKLHRSAFILNGQESLLEYIDYDSIYSEFPNGMPLDVFEGIYPDKNGHVMTVLCGLSFIESRINQIESIIEKKKNGIAEVMSNDTIQFNTKKSTMDIIMSMKKPSKKHDGNGKSVKDILSQFKR